MKRISISKCQYLYKELIRRGKSRQSALYDVAMIALGEYGPELSDEAANIITSPDYCRIDSEL